MRDLFARKPSRPRYVIRRMKLTQGEAAIAVNIQTGARRRVGGSVKVHLYLTAPQHRGKFNWSGLLKAHVFTSFEKAELEATALKLDHYQIVPVGYEGPPYWESKKHVRWQGSMARYSNPRVFLIGADGKRIEV
jgi:hypothetical protein